MSRISTGIIHTVDVSGTADTVSTDIPLDDIPKDTNQTESGQTETIKEAEAEPKIDETEEEEEEQVMFDDSTHGYLINYDNHRDVNNLLLAIFMYIIQMFLYSLLWSEAMGLVKEDQVEVTIGFYDCSDKNGKPDISQMNCEASEGTKWYHMVLPFVLLSIYIQPDIISCLSIIFSKKSCFKKVMALIVISESGFALMTGLLWCFQGIYKGSGYDAIVNSIGVLFIHDLDEQLFIAVEKMNSSRLKQCISRCCKRCTCCNNFCALFCTLVFIIIVGVCGQVVGIIAFANSGEAPEGSVDAVETTADYSSTYSSY